MDFIDDFSPGFGQEVLKYFSPASEFTTKIIETVKYVGGGGGCSCPPQEQLCNNSPSGSNTPSSGGGTGGS